MGPLIETTAMYQETIKYVFELMDKGEDDLTAEEIEELKILSIAIERYEDDVLSLKPVK